MTQVTVITPTYNRARELKRLYDSLLAQEDKDFNMDPERFESVFRVSSHEDDPGPGR